MEKMSYRKGRNKIILLELEDGSYKYSVGYLSLDGCYRFNYNNYSKALKQFIKCIEKMNGLRKTF